MKEIEKRLKRIVKIMDELLVRIIKIQSSTCIKILFCKVRLNKQQDLGRFLVEMVDEYR